jgi:hypothetical protein
MQIVQHFKVNKKVKIEICYAHGIHVKFRLIRCQLDFTSAQFISLCLARNQRRYVLTMNNLV